jgi:hypothetical protein
LDLFYRKITKSRHGKCHKDHKGNVKDVVAKPEPTPKRNHQGWQSLLSRSADQTRVPQAQDDLAWGERQKLEYGITVQSASVQVKLDMSHESNLDANIVLCELDNTHLRNIDSSLILGSKHLI